MFNSILGSKFSNKCKHSVKCIKCRIETIRKKKHAMERCLKRDVADLVSIGHDAKAFGRMDALLFEINQTSCYDMIEQCCCCILEHLPTMQKERDCPKETVEAVATLIFAAARFSDLPELADLRRGFTERYRTTVESYTNKEFVEKLQMKSFPQDQKLQLMKDIAREFNIDWDVNSFEYKISNPSGPTIDHPKIHFHSSNKYYIESHITDEKREATDRMHEVLNGGKTIIEKTVERIEVADRRNEVVNGRKLMLKKVEDTSCLTSDLQKQQIEFEKLKKANNNADQKIIQMEGDEHHSRSAVRKHQVQPEERRNVPTTPKNADAHRLDSTDKIKKVAANESENIEPHHLSKRPPPYVKTKGNQYENTRKRLEVHDGAVKNDKAINMFPPHTKFTENFNGTNSYPHGFVHSSTEVVVKEMEHNDQQRQPNGAVNPKSKSAFNLKPPYVKPNAKSSLESSCVKPTNYDMYSSSANGGDHKNTAFSVRRKHLEQGTAAHGGSTGEDHNLLWNISTKKAGVVVKDNVMHMDVNDQLGFSRHSKQIEDDAVYHGRRIHQTCIDQTIHGRRGINAAHDGGYEEEEQMDRLLEHFSKKSIRNEPGKDRTGTREPQTQPILYYSRIPEKAIKDEQYSKLPAHTPTKTASLPTRETLVGKT
ncbi:hypothetical protein KFK09_012985 [Dendrobium nobile]|uniref:Regulator of Vps4 activity in the MVB pathway protein n=1 Tax=Dendrobium nobile TaxID=94219 RepID=A0A8T3BH13_DENNO|nr:hypothetical protein KFK09_012985 [Dendrobium nobile]